MSRLKKRPDGYYCAWFNGKQFLGKTEKEAKQKRDRYKQEYETGQVVGPIRLDELAASWLPVAKAGVSATTYNQYATVMDILVSVLGHRFVSSIRPKDIQQVWLKLIDKSQSYISKATFLYRSFFQYALENGYCTSNPVNSSTAAPHKGTKGTHRQLTPEEIHLIETFPHRCQAAAMFMLKAGLRRGEVLALRKADISNDVIHIRKAVKFVSNAPVLGDTKNESSRRDVPLFRPLKPFYEALTDYVLPGDKGGMCSETAFVRAWESYLSDLSAYVNGVQKRWYHLTKEWKQEHPAEYEHYLELKEKDKAEAETYRLTGWKEISFRPHDLRHTFTSTARDKGIDINTVRLWLGHSSERMILQIYDHVSAEREQRMINIMDND